MKIEYLLGLKITPTDPDAVISSVVESVKTNTQKRIFHVNAHAFNLAFKDPVLTKNINAADTVFCDGFGVKVAAKIMGVDVGERMTPPDWIDSLCRTLAANGHSVFLLGDEDGIAERCAERLRQQSPGLKVAGCYHGFFKKEGAENDEVIKRINAAAPDVILVGFGMPLQEKWISENADKLNAKVFITVGAMFRWLIGEGSRAPRILSSNGFEWAWRLFTQPGKVWRRYLVGLPQFFFVVLKHKFRRKSVVIKS
jgi:N-acetylglucosaminyldiphosphoundecaprenol N-acetyl-beta-D-mannosaminyltransferase